MASSGVSGAELAVRETCLKSLEEFISTCQNDITSLLYTLNWTPEHFMKPMTKCVCGVNPDHHVPQSSLQQHQAVCELVTQGITREQAFAVLEDTSYFYEGAKCVYGVKIDKDLLNSVLGNHHLQNRSVFYGYSKMPLTPDQEEQQLKREERLVLSEYIVKKAKEANRLKQLGRDELLVSENLADLIKKDNEERKLDPVEEMAALRDYRRRRQTYRAKNVHITKKSHTEIMREVITNQMEIYARSLSDQADDAASQHSSSTEKTHSEQSEDVRGKGSRHERGYDRDERRRDRGDRERDGYRDNRYRDSRYRDRGRDNRDRDRSQERDSRGERSRDRNRDRSRDRGRSSRDGDRSRDHEYKRDDRNRTGDRSTEHESVPASGGYRDGHQSRNGSRIRDSREEGKEFRKEAEEDDKQIDDRYEDGADSGENEGVKRKRSKSKHKHRERKRSRRRSKSREKSRSTSTKTTET